MNSDFFFMTVRLLNCENFNLGYYINFFAETFYKRHIQIIYENFPTLILKVLSEYKMKKLLQISNVLESLLIRKWFCLK